MSSRGRREWRARLRFTGDPEVDRKNREEMLDRLAESMNRNRVGDDLRRAVDNLNEDLGRSLDTRAGAQAIVGRPVRELGAGGEEVDDGQAPPAHADPA
jgi:hypothetical protein